MRGPNLSIGSTSHWYKLARTLFGEMKGVSLRWPLVTTKSNASFFYLATAWAKATVRRHSLEK